jgi:hypothetical protein
MINRQNSSDNFQSHSRFFISIPYIPVLGLLLVLAFCISACTTAKPVEEVEYSAKIVGNWLGTVGDMKESITIGADGSFIAQVRPEGFISNTLSQGVTGTISGTWAINAKTIKLKIISAEDEHVINSETSSTIMAFTSNELSLKSERGETSTFERAESL